jgi:putative membrane protein
LKSEREAKIPSRLQLNDELALFRTHLANERTLMAYLRSGVALVIAGASILHFVEGGWLLAVGLICIPSGVAAAALGVMRFRVMSQSINRRARVHRATRPREARE